MYHFFRYPYQGYRQVKYLVNPVRCVEFTLCAICLILALAMIITHVPLPVWIYVIVIMTAAAFLLITLIDLISNSYKNPIYWNTWIMFAILGALCFFLSLGLFIAVITTGALVLMIVQIVAAITAVVFLLDALLILHTLKKRENEIWPEESAWVGCDANVQCGCDIIEDEEVEEEEEEEEKMETIIVERDITTKTLTSRKKEKMEEIETEHIIENLETPTRRRSTTSYGGTFPVGTNEVPLPSPVIKEEPVRSCNRKKITTPKLAGSQTIMSTPSGKVSTGPHGETYLADGTPLTETETEDGDVVFQDPSGIIYTKNGIPIIQQNEPKEIIKETSTRQITSQALVLRKGEWYTQDGKKVPSVHRAENGKFFTENGDLLYEIITTSGQSVYESPDGFLYADDGLPIGYNVIIRAEQRRSYEHRMIEDTVYVEGCTTASTKAINSDEMIAGMEVEPIEKAVDREKPKAKYKTDYSKQVGRRSRSKTSEEPRSEMKVIAVGSHYIKGITLDRIEIGAKLDSETAMTSVPGPKVETVRTREIIRTVLPSRNTPSSSTHSKIRSEHSSRCYLEDGTPLTEVRTEDSGKLYEDPDGQIYSSDGALLYTYQDEAGNKNDRSKPSEQVKPDTKNSRTVAISTRLVPKARHCKPASAPSSPHTKDQNLRPIRSAGNPAAQALQPVYQQSADSNQANNSLANEERCDCGPPIYEQSQGAISQHYQDVHNSIPQQQSHISVHSIPQQSHLSLQQSRNLSSHGPVHQGYQDSHSSVQQIQQKSYSSVHPISQKSHESIQQSDHLPSHSSVQKVQPQSQTSVHSIPQQSHQALHHNLSSHGSVDQRSHSSVHPISQQSQESIQQNDHLPSHSSMQHLYQDSHSSIQQIPQKSHPISQQSHESIQQCDHLPSHSSVQKNQQKSHSSVHTIPQPSHESIQKSHNLPSHSSVHQRPQDSHTSIQQKSYSSIHSISQKSHESIQQSHNLPSHSSVHQRPQDSHTSVQQAQQKSHSSLHQIPQKSHESIQQSHNLPSHSSGHQCHQDAHSSAHQIQQKSHSSIHQIPQKSNESIQQAHNISSHSLLQQQHQLSHASGLQLPHQSQSAIHPIIKQSHGPKEILHPHQTVSFTQFVHKPCQCGNIHYQAISTVRGNMCSCAFHGRQPQNETENQFGGTSNFPSSEEHQCSQLRPCGRKTCSCCGNTEEYGEPHLVGIRDFADRTPLATISECDCEAETSSSLEISSSQPTSSEPENTEISSSEKSLQGKKDPYENSPRETESGSVQTSETRIVKAVDVQRMTADLRKNN